MRVTPLSPESRRTSPRGGGVRAFVALTSVLVFGACATKGDLREVTDAIDAMRADSEQTRQLIAQVGAEMQALQDTLELEAGREVNSRGGLARDLRQIQDQLTRLEQLTGAIQAQVRRLEDRLQSVADRPMNPTQRPDDTEREGLQAEPVPQTVDVDEVYDIAQRAFNSGSLMTARMGFEQFLQADPDHPRAADAYFRLGDIAEQENRLDDAVRSFLRVPELYPDSDVVPQALYRAGRAEHDRGNDEAARGHLERVVANYPESGAAELARELLDEIG